MKRFKYNLFLEGIEWQSPFLLVWKLFIFQIILESSTVNSTFIQLDSLIGKNTPQTIEALGYPVESHVIRTADHVLLQYFRIPHGRNSISAYGEVKPVVLLVHGIVSSSIQWFHQEPDRNLPFILAEEGYDVWLANSRGNSYSNQLQGITTKNTSFWQFSADELGYFDIPAGIDYILHVTHQKQLVYIGHSQGTTQFFAALSRRPEYNSKIRLMVAMAPGVFLGNIRGLLKLVSYIWILPNFFGLPEILTNLGLGEFLPSFLLKISYAVAPYACSVEPLRKVCQSVVYSALGFDFEQFLPGKWASVLSRFPDTTSLLAFSHLTQLAISNAFRMYDHGPLKNLKTYGSLSPPNYKLSRITAPVALFSGPNDLVIQPPDVLRLARQLPNVVLNYRVPFDKFNHGDFIWAKDAYSLVYVEVLRLLAAYR